MLNDPKTGRFVKGQHWRIHKAFRDRAYLLRQYVDLKRSCSEIACDFGVTEAAILFWLRKHDIKRRDVSGARAVKHWGSFGERNPMHGKTGILNPNWRGGLTPARQTIYASSQWKQAARAVRKRDKTCRLCGSGANTEIHHIEPFSCCPLLVMDVGNMILLCDDCHKKLRGKERRWRRKLYSILKGG